MRTVKEIAAGMGLWSTLSDREETLRLWTEEIIEECAGNFECTMENSDEMEDMTDEIGKMVPKQVPVLVRASILAVKNKIQ